MTDLVDAYCAAWNEPDPVRRTDQLTPLCTPDVVYTDPRVRTMGVDELVAFVSEVRASRPGASVQRTSVVDQHHGWVRFAWHVRLADGTTLPEGLDVCEVRDGRLALVLGFFGSLQPR
ncbi:MAG: nuclear transport factor 2 family protein [Myxococcales bacterium]|nr:nuclear transport factor 2 family protein [Myxococcales bacterium]